MSTESVAERLESRMSEVKRRILRRDAALFKKAALAEERDSLAYLDSELAALAVEMGRAEGAHVIAKSVLRAAQASVDEAVTTVNAVARIKREYLARRGTVHMGNLWEQFEAAVDRSRGEYYQDYVNLKIERDGSE